MSVRSYETQDGQKRYVTEVVANFVAQTMGSEKRTAAAPQTSMPTAKPAAEGKGFDSFGKDANDEEIPF